MANSHWRSHVITQCLIVFVALIIGWFTDHAWASAFLAAMVLLCHQTFQLARLERWITGGAQNEPPDLYGYLSIFSDRMHYLQRREKKAQATLKSLLKRAQTTANALSDAYLTLNESDQLEWWNKAANTLLGLQYPRDIGQPIVQLLRDPDFITYFDQETNLNDTDKSFKRAKQVRISSPANPKKHIEIELTHYGNNEKLIHVRDITQLIHLEQVRSDFIANISHELRTPMTVIAGYVELFEDFSDQLPPPIAPSIGTIKSQVRRMQNLVEDLFTLTRFEDPSAKISSQQIDLHWLLRQIMDEAKILAREKRIKLTMPLPPTFNLWGDLGQIRSALSNLVNNAVHYTNPKGTVTLTTELNEKGAYIHVQDTGIGIEKNHIPRLTERFYRVDPSRSTATGGTGLGLAIVKHALLRHHANLEIRSTKGVGSCFTCHFPLSSACLQQGNNTTHTNKE